MGTSVEWERVEGDYCLTVNTPELDLTIITPSLALASKLTTMLIDLELRAYEYPPVPNTGTIVPEPGSLDALRIERNDPSHAYAEPPDESELPPMATQDVDDNVGDLLAGTVP